MELYDVGRELRIPNWLGCGGRRSLDWLGSSGGTEWIDGAERLDPYEIGRGELLGIPSAPLPSSGVGIRLDEGVLRRKKASAEQRPEPSQDSHFAHSPSSSSRDRLRFTSASIRPSKVKVESKPTTQKKNTTVRLLLEN